MNEPRSTVFYYGREAHETWGDELREVAPGSTILMGRLTDDQPLSEIEGLYGGVPKDMLDKLPKLRWIQAGSAGVEGLLYPEMVENDIVVTNCKGLFSIFIAELAVAHLLALTSQVLAAALRPDRKTWLYKPIRATELYGGTALIIGLGGIGSEIAERIQAFHMKIIAVDPIRKAAAGMTMVRPNRLDEVLPEADVVFITAPATTARKLFDRERLFHMKKGAFLINSSRGKVVDTEALTEALQTGHLAGAGVDALDPEPLPPDHPLWDMMNVSITPHIGGNTDALDRRRFLFLRENLWRFVRGVPLLNVVNKRRGF
jgi:phosphoglycerate dehydrogenase-like enzyme